MGVKDLWGIISPTSELIKLQDIDKKIIAIDLSCWICDSQNANMGASVVKPHLRNLFFRTVSLVKAGILPVFVLEGDAPIIKHTTIQNRIEKHSKCPTKVFRAGSTRTRLKGLLKQCRELLTLMGLTCIQAEGEAEATCAALSYHQLADGVITQDSDVFLYGADVVFRNFSGNKQKATVEKYKATVVKEKLGLNRESLICLAVILGCDYLPSGIPGVGKENALKLIRYWKSSGILHPLQRLLEWKVESNPFVLDGISKGKIRNSERTVEDIVKEKALRTPGFPFHSVIDEFRKQLSKPKVKIKWAQPDMANLVLWCVKMLGWEAEYAMEKVIPFVTFWIISNSLSSDTYYLKPLKINRKCILQGVNSYEVTWQVSKLSVLPEGLPTEYNIVEPSHLIQERFLPLVQEYDFTVSTKRGKKLKGKKKSNNVVANKEGGNDKTLKEMEKLGCSLSDESVDEAELSRIINNLGNMKINRQESKPKNETCLKQSVEVHSTVRQEENDLAYACKLTTLNSDCKFKLGSRAIINSKIKNFLLSPRQTTLDKFYSSDQMPKKPDEVPDISVINISSDFEDSVLPDKAKEYNMAITGGLCISNCSLNYYELPDETNLPDLESTWQQDDNFTNKNASKPDNCEVKIDSRSVYLSLFGCEQGKSGDKENCENVSKDLFEDSESLIEVSNSNSQPSKKIIYNRNFINNEETVGISVNSSFHGPSLSPKLYKETEVPNAVNSSSESALCFQLLDSFSNITFTPISTPLNSSKLTFNSENRSALVTTVNKLDFSDTNAFKNGKPNRPCNSTPKVGEKVALPFDTPKSDILSLAERLRGRFDGIMNDVLDDM